MKLPQYDIAAMVAKTKAAPIWVHFGAGNLFRGFIASLQQRLLNQGLAEKGIIAVETYDYDIIDQIFTPYDCRTINVILHPDGNADYEMLTSVAKAFKADADDVDRIFADPALQMASFTITEKGYAPHNADIQNGPAQARHAMGLATALLLQRYQAGRYPIAMVSLDNCAGNGQKLRSAILEIAGAWCAGGFTDADFMSYLADETTVSFPWSMIDKITPHPSETVERLLADRGIQGMKPIVTSKGTVIAPFVNSEHSQYLVIEDTFPNGRPLLEKAGVHFADRDTVIKAERMKVTACLNPLHTAMSVYGCLLGYTRIHKEMKDPDIVALIHRLGYGEGLPVVADPGILSPRAFLDEVMERRLPNPFMPDTPQRIAADTSQKVGIRFGETIKRYIEEGRDLGALIAVPLAIAGWLRYLLAVDDQGYPMALAPDPMRVDLQAQLACVVWNSPASYAGQLRPILANAALFDYDLTKTVLAGKVEAFFVEQLTGPGSVRATLRRHLT
ncbi:MAG: mannitol dehydrogenase family protein [Clostridia bacterium]|nr:mannitol dehydrogenase family protein [Clostridia bacterium]